MIYAKDLGYFPGLLSSFDLDSYVYKIYLRISSEKIRIYNF